MVRSAAQRVAVAHLQPKLGLSARRAYTIVSDDRTIIRYRSCRAPDTKLREQLRELANARRRFGYRRLFVLLRQQGEPSGLNRIYRYRDDQATAGRQEGFQLLPRRCVVERTFAWLGKCRRLSKDLERSAPTTPPGSS